MTLITQRNMRLARRFN